MGERIDPLQVLRRLAADGYEIAPEIVRQKDEPRMACHLNEKAMLLYYCAALLHSYFAFGHSSSGPSSSRFLLNLSVAL